MVCSQCGHTLREGIRFCPSCGASQDTAPPAPVQQSAPAVAAEPGKRVATKTILIVALIGFIVFVGIIAAVWLYFFPPGVYVQDSYRKANKELAGSLQGVNATFSEGLVHLHPPNQKFYVLLYGTPASNKATVEATAVWKDGDQDSIFGIACCAMDEDNFTVLMIGAKGDYLVNSFVQGEWYDLTGFLRLPKTMKIEKNVPYKLKLVSEGDYLSAYLNETLLIRLLDASSHKGRVGIYAQGGKSGSTDIGFDDFKAKKNSLFQKEEENE